MKKNGLNIAYICSLAVLVLLTACLHIFIRPAFDDFYYVTFLDNGFIGFLSAMREHYLTLTGRTLVHVLLCPLLLFNMLPFKIVNVSIILSLCYVISKFTKEKGIKYFLCALSLFWLIGTSVLSDGVLWGAGSFNYLFPAFLVVLFAYLYKNKANFFIPILAFLSAATVEMSGFLVIFTVIYYFNKNKKAYSFLNLICACTGYVTLFLSGGVSKRLSGNEFYEIGLFERCISNLSLFSRKMLELNGVGILIVILLVSLFLLALKNKQRTLQFFNLLSAFLAFLVVTNIIYHNVFVCAIALFAFFTILANAVILYKDKEKDVLFFALCMSLSLAVCVASPVVGYRMLFPSAMFIICIITKILPSLNIKFSPIGLCALSILSLVALIIGFSQNSTIIDQNNKSALKNKASDTIYFENVPNEMLGAGTVPSSINFGEYYIKHNNLSATAIITDEKIKNYVPLKNAVQNGAKVYWELGCAKADFCGKTYSFSACSKAADTGAFSVKLLRPVRIIHGTTYICEDDFNKIFN